MSEARCETCRFGNKKQYREPDPLPEPPQPHWLFGVPMRAKYQRRWDEAMHAENTRRAKEDVPCMRYPEIRRVSKDHWCGEHQPKGSPDE